MSDKQNQPQPTERDAQHPPSQSSPYQSGGAVHQKQESSGTTLLDELVERVAQPKPKRIRSLDLPTEIGDFITNYDDDSEEGQIALSRASNPADIDLKPYIGKTIKVVGAVLKCIELEDMQKPGELKKVVYASIVLDTGEIIGTASKIPVDQLSHFIRQRTGRTDLPPAEYEVRTHKSKPPKQPYFSLRRVLPPKTEKTTGGAR
jgi:hypothetical protein